MKVFYSYKKRVLQHDIALVIFLSNAGVLKFINKYINRFNHHININKYILNTYLHKGGGSVEIIAVTNQKGGVAKTTTSINLGAALAEKSKDVLLIDLDPQANMTLGLEFGKKLKNTYRVMMGEIEFINAIFPTDFGDDSWGRYNLMPSHIDLANIELELSSKLGRETVFKDSYEKSKDKIYNYDYILIDTTPSLGLLTVNAMSLADSLIIPLEPNIFALDGIEQLINVYKLIRNKFNENLRIKGALLAKIDARTNIADHFHEKLREVFGDKLFQTTISQNVKLNESQLEGEPVNLYSPKAKGALQYQRLAEELIENE